MEQPVVLVYSVHIVSMLVIVASYMQDDVLHTLSQGRFMRVLTVTVCLRLLVDLQPAVELVQLAWFLGTTA